MNTPCVLFRFVFCWRTLYFTMENVHRLISNVLNCGRYNLRFWIEIFQQQRQNAIFGWFQNQKRITSSFNALICRLTSRQYHRNVECQTFGAAWQIDTFGLFCWFYIDNFELKISGMPLNTYHFSVYTHRGDNK